MRILFVGDIVGRAGRRILKEHLGAVCHKYGVDFTILNVENAAGGFGITRKIAEEFLRLQVDVMTSGNHIWDNQETFAYLDTQPLLLRPANYPPGLPGSGMCVATSQTGISVAVLNLQGRVFMPPLDCPFRTADKLVESLKARADVVIVDFHAEATSEKMAMGWYLDGKVSAVLGTHTHVPTSDHRILPGGTAYVTDVGMTGAYDSIIGMQVETALPRFLTGIARSRFEPASGNPRFCSVLVEIDQKTGKGISIERIDLWESGDAED